MALILAFWSAAHDSAARVTEEKTVRIFAGRRLGPLYVGVSFRPSCSHCGKTQPFNWLAFFFGVAIGLAGLAALAHYLSV